MKTKTQTLKNNSTGEKSQDQIFQDLLGFHLAGKKPEEMRENFAEVKLIPALLSNYRDLSRIRYDYPMVLIDNQKEAYAGSLSSIIDEVLEKSSSQGEEGERMKNNVLKLESAARKLTEQGKSGSLTEIWNLSAEAILENSESSNGKKEVIRKELETAGCKKDRDI